MRFGLKYTAHAVTGYRYSVTGEYARVGEQMARVRIADIAMETNVSKATVSRILNNCDNAFISDQTRELVKKTAKEMGYTPNLHARALSKGRTDVIALALPELRSPFFSWIADTACVQLRQIGFEVIMQVGMWNEVAARSPYPAGSPVDAVLSWTYDLTQGPIGSVVKEYGVPAVRIGLGPEIPGEGDSALSDLESAVRCAIGSFLESGRKRICFVTSSVDYGENEYRQSIYSEMMHEAGMQREMIVADDYDKPAVYQTVLSYLSQNPDIDALFCLSDYYAIAAHAAIRKTGRRIPEDVALIGCDGIEDGDLMDPPLSTIVQPVEKMVALACQILKNRLENPDSPPMHERIPAVFVKKASS